MDPSGTLTFLFTDMEGSSQRWEQYSGAMPMALAHHDQLITAAVAAYGGTVFKHTGDGVCAVFGTAPAAVAGALAAQQALLAENWGEVGALPVRMALHTGSADYREGDWFGPALNRAARLLATAHGGQVVVSRATEELAQDDLPPKAELTDLGEHCLGELARMERIFQLTHPDLRSVFPPLRSRGSHRHNLPTMGSSFVGRQRELAEVATLLGQYRLVTLTGAGGTGKTRLALEAAAATLGSFPDGVFLVELGPLADPDLAAPQVLSALGLGDEGPDAAPGGARERLARYLTNRRTLLVLDNCEHVLDAAVHLAQLLIQRCSEVTLLATSREPLSLPGERPWRVPSLSLPGENSVDTSDLTAFDAVALFRERARLADPSFELTAANAEAVVRICRRLDGLPLALELAAARLRVLSAQQVAQRLDDRFRLLSGGARFAVPRHRTLRAAVDWSWELLSEREQALLRRLSVFAGKFSVDAAEVVAADGEALHREDVLDLLTALVDKSLVAVKHGQHEARYMLTETIREYAAEHLAAAKEVEAARDRHLDHYQSIPALSEWGREDWFHVLAADQDNFRTALDWSLASGKCHAGMRLAGALTWFWTHEGRFEEGCAWLMRALGSSADAPAGIRSHALAGLSYLVLQQGDPAWASSLIEESRTLARSTGDVCVRSTADLFAGMLSLQGGDHQRAKGLLEEARGGFESLGWLAGAALCRFQEGWVALAEGHQDVAVASFERAMAALSGDDASAEAASTGGGVAVHVGAALAPLIAALGDLRRAEQLAANALENARALGRRTVVMTQIRTAEMWVLAGQASRAGDCLVEAITLLRDLGGRAWVADSLELVAIILAEHARPEAATRLAAKAEELRQKQGGVQLVHEALEQSRDKLRHTLGPDQFATELSMGQALTLDDALHYALDELVALESPEDLLTGTNLVRSSRADP